MQVLISSGVSFISAIFGFSRENQLQSNPVVPVQRSVSMLTPGCGHCVPAVIILSALQRFSLLKRDAHGHSLYSNLPRLNSVLLTGRWQFSTSLNRDSHVSDCTDDVCAQDITLPALLHWQVLRSHHCHTSRSKREHLWFTKPQGRGERKNWWSINYSQMTSCRGPTVTFWRFTIDLYFLLYFFWKTDFFQSVIASRHHGGASFGQPFVPQKCSLSLREQGSCCIWLHRFEGFFF